MASRVLTIMFTDISGYTERTSRTTREDLRKLLRTHEKLLVPQVVRFGGRVVKTMGDALIAVFESPTNAVLCGLMMQETLRDHNRDLDPKEQIQVRVAINTGEVEERAGDVFGEAVNIAARIEGITDVLEIFFTESVYLAMNKSEVPSSEVGAQRLKGIPEAIKVYRVIQDRNSEQYQQLVERLRSTRFTDVPIPSTYDIPAVTAPRTARRRLIAVVLSAIVLVALAGILIFARYANRDLRLLRDEIRRGDLTAAHSRANVLLQRKEPSVEIQDAVRELVQVETDALIKDGRMEAAIDLMERRQKEYATLNLKPVRRRVLLALAEAALPNRQGNYARASWAYREVLADNPKDEEALRSVVKTMGINFLPSSTSMGISAAMQLAKMGAGPLDAPVRRTLVAALGGEDARRETAAEIRGLLKARAADTLDELASEIKSTDPDMLANIRMLLQESGKLTPTDALRFLTAELTHAAEESDWRAALKDWGQALAGPQGVDARRALENLRDTLRKEGTLLEGKGESAALDIVQKKLEAIEKLLAPGNVAPATP